MAQKQVLRAFRLERFSIKTRFMIVYGTMILFFVFLLSAYSYWRFASIIERKSIDYARGVLEQVRNNIDADLEQIDLASYIIFANPDVLRVLRYQKSVYSFDAWQRYSIEKLMSDVMFSRRDISSIALYDLEGRYVATNSLHAAIEFDTLASTAHEADGKFEWLPKDEVLDTLPMVRLIRDMEMNEVGYLRFDIWARAFRQKLSDETVRLGGDVFVVDENRIVVSGRPVEGDDRRAELLAMANLVAPEGQAAADMIRDRNVIVGFTSRASRWRFVGVIPLSAITREVAMVRFAVIISALLSIALFNLISYLVIRKFTDPIHEIADQMKQAQVVDWMPTIAYQGNDEVAYLATQFTEMAGRLGTLVEQVVEERSRHTRQELLTLQAQINPHFLYNTLDIVNWMAIERDVPEIGTMVRALSDMMRYSISNSRSVVVLGDELEYIKQYLLIQKRRFTDRFEVIYDVREEALAVEIPKLTLQPIVENCLVHGFKGVDRCGTVSIAASVTGGGCVVDIADDGVGISSEAIEKVFSGDNLGPPAGNHTGIGVYNVHRRIQLLFGEHYGLTIERRQPSGTRCLVRLPAGGESSRV